MRSRIVLLLRRLERELAVPSRPVPPVLRGGGRARVGER